jgi:hypothetical protein
VATEASRGQDGLHILIEIKVLASCDARLRPMATRSSDQQHHCQQGAYTGPEDMAGIARSSLELDRSPGEFSTSKVAVDVRHGKGEDRMLAGFR